VDGAVQLLTAMSALVAALGGAVAARRHIPVQTAQPAPANAAQPGPAGRLPAWPVFALAAVLFAVAMVLFIASEV
jgi:type VI protein secretion system component VasF